MTGFTEKDGFFVVTHVTRDDIVSALDAEKKPALKRKIMKLSDDTMRHIARKLGEGFCESGGYYDILRELASDTMEE